MYSSDGSVPDFVIKRKRKRAVDPCLGFYLSSPSTNTKTSSKRALITTESEHLSVPPIAVLSPIHTTSDTVHTSPSAIEDADAKMQDETIEVLTVDAFLRRSAERPKRPKKNYGNRKRMVVALEGHSKEDRTLHSPRLPDTEITSKSSSRMNKKTKVADRLIQAAILAHGDPSERLRRRYDSQIIDSTRRPLRFVSAQDAYSSMMISRARAVTLADPRKIAPFQPPSFIRRELPARELVICTPKRKPVTGWKMACPGLASRLSRHNRPVSIPIQHDKTSSRIPLHLIPLKDAEEALRVTPNNRLNRVKSQLTHVNSQSNSRRLPALFLQSQKVKRKHYEEAKLSSPSPKRVKFSSPISSSSNRKSKHSDQTTVIIIPNSSPKLTSHPALELDASLHSQSQFITPRNLSTLRNTASPQLPIVTNHIVSDPPSELGLHSTNKKPLKALASFFGNFLETARQATQLQASASSRDSHKRIRTKTDHPSSRKSLQPAIITPLPNPASSVAGMTHQESLLVAPVNTHNLTSHHQTLQHSIKRQVSIPLVPFSTIEQRTRETASPIAHLVPNSVFSRNQNSGIVNSLSPTPRTKSVTSFNENVIPTPHQATSPQNDTSWVPSSDSRIQILVALQPPKAMVVLSSSPGPHYSADNISHNLNSPPTMFDNCDEGFFV